MLTISEAKYTTDMIQIFATLFIYNFPSDKKALAVLTISEENYTLKIKEEILAYVLPIYNIPSDKKTLLA